MTGRSIRRAVAVVAAATLTVTLAGSALAAEVDPSAMKKPVVKCDGKVATRVGTPGGDVIRGTAKRDIIAGLGGHDIILGRGGNDVICGGAGNDKLVGGAGRDKLLGQTGRDRLFGSGGLDRLFGGQHNDVLLGGIGPDLLFGGAGSDRLNGGPGIDACYQNSGNGVLVRCELPAAPVAPPTPPTPPAPEPGPVLHDLTGILAVAYSDIDGLPGYSTDDRLISKLVDTDGNGLDAGDKIVMGIAVASFDGMTWTNWRVHEHTVVGEGLGSDSVTVTSDDGWFQWQRGGSGGFWEHFRERDLIVTTNESEFVDIHSAPADDRWAVNPASPSEPAASGGDSRLRQGDNEFLDVEIPSIS